MPLCCWKRRTGESWGLPGCEERISADLHLISQDGETDAQEPRQVRLEVTGRRPLNARNGRHRNQVDEQQDDRCCELQFVIQPRQQLFGQD
jgi:hypothetical protein